MKKATKKVIKKPVVKKASELFEVCIKIMGRPYTAKGETSLEALSNLQIKNVKGVGVLTMVRGDKKKETVLPMVIVNRLFNLSGTMRQIVLKQLAERVNI